MNRPTLPAAAEQRFQRLKAHLPRTRDPVLVVLKCHLLLEEQLDGVISSRLRRPDDLPAVRLSFGQKLRLATALTGRPANRERRLIEQLNSLRNKLSHRLDGYDINAEILEILEAYAPGDDDPSPSALTPLQRLSYLKSAVIVTCGYLEGVASFLQKAPDHK